MLFFLISVLSLPAQDSTALKKFRILSAGISGGGMQFYDATTQPHDLELLAPNMVLLNENKTGFDGDGRSRGRTNAMFLGATIDLGRQLRNNGKPSHTRYTCAFSMNTLAMNYVSFYRTQLTPFDTVTADNGDVIFLDSLVDEQYHFSMNMHVASLELGQRFYSHDSRELFFIGYAVQGAIGYSAHLNGTYTSRTRRIATTVQPATGFSPMMLGYAEDAGTVINESVPLDNLFLCRISIPAGIELHGKGFNKPEGVALRFETRYGVEFMPVPGVRTYARSFLSVQGSLSYRFHSRSTQSAHS